MAGATKNYNATFAIGAKLLGSFRGVMAQAQTRLKALGHTAVNTGKTILKAFALLGASLSLFAGFAAAGIFRKIFEGASDEAIDANQRLLKLSVLLMQHNEIRKGGLALAQRQAAQIFKANEALEEQGVIGTDLLDSASAQLAVYGYSPRKIKNMMGPMSDLLVTMKTVNATQEDAVALSVAWGKTMKTGNAKPMQAFGFYPKDVKQFKGMSREGRNNEMMRFAKGFGGANARGRDTPEGKLVVLRNAMKKLSEQIGHEMLPAQAEMAQAWLKALPELKPVMVGTIKLLIMGLKWLAGVVANDLIPAWENLKAFLGGPMSETWNSLKQAWNDMAGKVGPELMKILSSITGVFSTNKDAGQILTDIMFKLRDAIKWVGDNATWLVPLIASVTVAWYAASVAIGVANAVMAISPIGLVIIGMAALVGTIIFLHKKFGTLTNALKAFWQWLESGSVIIQTVEAMWTAFVSDLSDTWEHLKAAWQTAQPVLIAVFEGIGSAIKDSILAPIHAIQDAWKSSVDFIKNHVPTWAGGVPTVPLPPVPGAPASADTNAYLRAMTGLPPAPAPAAALPAPPQSVVSAAAALPPRPASAATALPKAPPQATVPYAGGMATGGIIRGHSLLQVAERGPEAIIPLAGGPRAEGLLHYASRAMGMGGITNHRQQSITYAPQITIHGNATEKEQSSLDSRLKRSAADLIAEIKAATYQERRLSFEAGYSG